MDGLASVTIATELPFEGTSRSWIHLQTSLKGKAIRAVPMTGPVLIVEDDKKTASLIALYLEREGFQTVVAYDGAQALDLAQSHKPIFVILDLMLPVVDGWEVCRQLRQSSDVPILILSAREEEVDRVSGLTLGADDYVVKPFSPRELVARVKAILRRGRLATTKETKILSFEGLGVG